MIELANPYKHITWECTTVCNYACSYCAPELHDSKYRWPSSKQTDKIINLVKDFSNGEKIAFDIMGGEPTLWPSLEIFCEALKDIADISFSSNGSRTLRYWKSFKAPLDRIYLSFHAEFADVDHFLNITKILSSKYTTHVFIMYNPAYKQKCLELADKIESNNIQNCSFAFKFINDDAINYTEEDKHLMSRTYQTWNENSIDYRRSHFSNSKLKQNGKVINDLYAYIRDGKNKYKGWKCQQGDNYLYIDKDGSIYGAACRTVKYGNVWKDYNIDLQRIICTKNTCSCVADIRLTKKWNITTQELT